MDEDTCLECGKYTADEWLFKDPRDPPLDEDYDCLCVQCVKSAYRDAIESAQERIAELVAECVDLIGNA